MGGERIWGRGRGWELQREWLGENAPRELCPSFLPPNSRPLHILLAGTQPFPFSTDGTAPPGKGCKVLGVLGNYQRQKGGRGPGRELAIAFSFEKRETEALKAYVQD